MGAELAGGMGELTDWTKGADGASEERFALLWRRIKDHGIAQSTTNGAQYLDLAVVSGVGGTYARQPDPNLARVPKGGVVTAFKLLPQQVLRLGCRDRRVRRQSSRPMKEPLP